MTLTQNKRKEIEHDRQIKEEAEFLWGWDTPAGKLRAKRRASMIVDAVKGRGGRSVLEIGSGTGMFTRSFCDAGLEVYGMDISLDLLEKARGKTSGPNAAGLVVADAQKLPYKDCSVDAVVGVCVLHHLLDLVPPLREMRRVLKNDGIIVFSEPNMMNPQLMVQKNIKPIKRIHVLGETEDETAFFKWQMRRFLREAGFRDISVEPFDFLHPWTPKALVPFVERLGACFEKVPLVREIAGSLFIKAVK